MPQLTAEEDNHVQQLMKALRKNRLKDEEKPIERKDVQWLLDKAVAVFKEQPMLVETKPPISVCGDIHGQFADLVRLFEHNGWPPKTRYLFLGDYVDRGPKNIETICTMFGLKIQHPTDFYMLRGNHESRTISRVYGFYDEVRRRYDRDLWEAFTAVFDWMPIAGLVSDRILCMHGGISPHLTCMEDVRSLKRPLCDPEGGVAADLLWADPDKNVSGFQVNTRGISYTFGADAVQLFCEAMGVDLVARAHQVVQDGYEMFADGRLITIFTAPDYCNQFRNSGGILCIDPKMNCSIKQLASRMA